MRAWGIKLRGISLSDPLSLLELSPSTLRLGVGTALAMSSQINTDLHFPLSRLRDAALQGTMYKSAPGWLAEHLLYCRFIHCPGPVYLGSREALLGWARGMILDIEGIVPDLESNQLRQRRRLARIRRKALNYWSSINIGGPK